MYLQTFKVDKMRHVILKLGGDRAQQKIHDNKDQWMQKQSTTTGIV